MRRLAWGGEVPMHAPAAWGCRAILEHKNIDLVPDRRAFYYKEDEKELKELGKWLDTRALKELRKYHDKIGFCQDDNTIWSFAEKGFAMLASPRASFGYLYIVAWKEGEYMFPYQDLEEVA